MGLCRRNLVPLLCATLLGSSSLAGQSAKVAPPGAPVTFSTGTNLVLVTVVARDHKGHSIGSLGRDDFRLFDNGKPQVISKFTVERLTRNSDNPVVPTTVQMNNSPVTGKTPANAAPTGEPDRFLAYLFDDLHMSPAELNYTRDAARRQIDKSQHELDRVAIYTTSGQHMTDFTGDREKLHTALDALSTGQAAATKAMLDRTCPPMTYYTGDLIYNNNNADALAMAVSDAAQCSPGVTGKVLTMMAQNAARDAVFQGDRETLWTLDNLRLVVAKMASMRGQRSIVLISPGFLVLSDRLEEETALIERSIRSNVVIGALDARGLYTMIPGGDASERGNPSPTLITKKAGYKTSETLAVSNVMDELAAGTGGKFYKGTNDMDEGLAVTAAAPEYAYVLGFTPQELKSDGRYHTLKVSLNNVASAKGTDLQVRKGYYAPKSAADPKDQAKQQVEEAFFSRDEIHDLPAALHTRYFKLENGDATLSAITTVDAKKLDSRKEGGRNLDGLTVDTGLFDSDGNFVNGIQKVITLKLLDETLEKRLSSGMGVKSDFTVHPGRYVVRMVVRDTEGQLMAAQSSQVDIP